MHAYSCLQVQTLPDTLLDVALKRVVIYIKHRQPCWAGFHSVMFLCVCLCVCLLTKYPKRG